MCARLTRVCDQEWSKSEDRVPQAERRRRAHTTLAHNTSESVHPAHQNSKQVPEKFDAILCGSTFSAVVDTILPCSYGTVTEPLLASAVPEDPTVFEVHGQRQQLSRVETGR